MKKLLALFALALTAIPAYAIEFNLPCHPIGNGASGTYFVDLIGQTQSPGVSLWQVSIRGIADGAADKGSIGLVDICLDAADESRFKLLPGTVGTGAVLGGAQWGRLPSADNFWGLEWISFDDTLNIAPKAENTFIGSFTLGTDAENVFSAQGMLEHSPSSSDGGQWFGDTLTVPDTGNTFLLLSIGLVSMFIVRALHERPQRPAARYSQSALA